VKLRRQTPAKALIVASTLGLLGALFGVVRAEPRIKAAPPEPTPAPAVNYDRFFAPSTAAPAADEATPAPRPPHTRTRAS
jgi:hypothetical protein